MTECKRKFGFEHRELFGIDHEILCRDCHRRFGDHTAAESVGCPVVDVVNSPKHYTNGQVECIQAIESALTPEEFRGYVKGVIIKYVWREKLKGGDEDLEKARWYINRLFKKEE